MHDKKASWGCKGRLEEDSAYWCAEPRWGDEAKRELIRKCVLEGVSLASSAEEGKADRLRELGFLGLDDLLAPAMLLWGSAMYGECYWRS